MGTASRIEWTESTWNPVVGCSKVSEGCRNCYAERLARRLAAMAVAARARGERPGRTEPYREAVGEDGRWTGAIVLNENALDDPFRWRRPRLVFVNSMSDMFHERLPIGDVARVFDVMNRCPQHTFQILTKRPERALRLASDLRWTPNIWLGTSVESRRHLDRIRTLRRLPARTRFLSLEPLLGPLARLPLAGIDWVIAGGESGPRSRPACASWVRAIRDQCVQKGVPFFFKQWGGVNKKRAGRVLDGRMWDEMPMEKGSLDDVASRRSVVLR